MKYCEKCGSKLIVKGEYKGTYSKLPEYFDTSSGKPLFHRHVACPNQTFFGSHGQYWVDFSKD